MARKIKKFGKVINDNPVAMEIYTKQRELFDQVAELEKQKHENFLVYVKMEGMYSIGTEADPWAGQGSRGYDYKYSNQEIRTKEEAEREAYLLANVIPLKQKIDKLNKQAWALEESLCVAVCGYNTEEYYVRIQLAKAEKELARQIAYVEQLKEKLAEIENRG